MQDKEHVYIKDRSAWRAWLTDHHKQTESIWLVYDKGTNRSLSYDDIVEEALCFGWVDSRPGIVDDSRSKLYISPRKPKSVWSKKNKERIAKLIEKGLMEPAGLQSVETAKQNGTWQALEHSDAFTEPAELTDALNKNPVARTNYDAFPPSSKKIILEWIYAAKKDETKMNRINETVEQAAKGIKAHHYRQ